MNTTRQVSTLTGRGLAILFASAALTGSALNAQTVTMSPGYTSIGVNATLQYTASVTGITPETITWKVNNVTGGNSTYGTITQSGLYTAPAAVPANGVTVTALAADNKTYAITYVNIAAAGPTITSTNPVSPIPNGNYTVTLTGSGFQAGAFVMEGGTRYSSTFVNANTIKVSGWHGGTGAGSFSVQNPGTLYGPAFPVTWSQAGPPPPQAIAPTTVSVNLGATQQFTSANATSWSATAGTITQTGLFTAPATMPSSSTVSVKAVGPGGTAAAVVTLINPNPQVVAPTTATLALGATQQFTSANATTWNATFGSITQTGLYTAPSVWPASGTDTVSVTGPNGTATATITVTPPTPLITSVGTNGQIPLGIFSATVTGTGLIAQSVAQLNGNPVTTVYSGGSLTISGFIAQSGPASVTVSNGSVTSAPFPVQVGVPNAQVSAAAARRFLQQSAFGPTPSEASHVQQVGFTGWLAEQFAMPQVTNYNSLINGSSQGGDGQMFLANAVTNPDQLRQRVALALSEIFVVSLNKLIWNGDLGPFQNMLLADSFTSFPQILSDVTLSPAMGEYLDMANNAKANPAAGTVANENYAREIMQLFTIGTKMLNSDGTVQSNANGPIPTYTQTDVTELARVFTGWTYAPKNGNNPIWGSYINSAGPMVPFSAMHDYGPKTLVGGAGIQANLSPANDLQAALNVLIAHPNCAPFISKQLIQHLVKSNPSPAYVQRVVNVFLQTQGDMKAIITAILTDQEARANDEGGADQAADGHFQEPVLLISGIVRAFGGQMTTQNYYASDMASLGQDVFNAPSVFNYFSPGYVAGGTGGLLAPEMQIDNPNASILRENLVANLFNQYSNPIASYGPGTTIDLTPLLPLAATPSTLVDAIDLTLTRGVMPAPMKQAIVAAVTADSNGSLRRVQTAIYLTLSSNYYNVWH